MATGGAARCHVRSGDGGRLIGCMAPHVTTKASHRTPTALQLELREEGERLLALMFGRKTQATGAGASGWRSGAAATKAGSTEQEASTRRRVGKRPTSTPKRRAP